MNEPTFLQQFWLILRELLPWFALAGSGYGIYLAAKKQPFDIRKLKVESDGGEVNVAKQYRELADAAAKSEIELRKEIQTVREKLEEIKIRHESELEEIRKLLEAAEERAAKFEDWAHRLVSQIESLGEVPVPFEPKPRSPTQPRKE